MNRLGRARLPREASIDTYSGSTDSIREQAQQMLAFVRRKYRATIGEVLQEFKLPAQARDATRKVLNHLVQQGLIRVDVERDVEGDPDAKFRRARTENVYKRNARKPKKAEEKE